jgi:hypothetical protein
VKLVSVKLWRVSVLEKAVGKTEAQVGELKPKCRLSSAQCSTRPIVRRLTDLAFPTKVARSSVKIGKSMVTSSMHALDEVASKREGTNDFFS